jgi:hypothetical protein
MIARLRILIDASPGLACLTQSSDLSQAQAVRAIPPEPGANRRLLPNLFALVERRLSFRPQYTRRIPVSIPASVKTLRYGAFDASSRA